MRFTVFALGAAAMLATTTESRSLSDGVAQFEDSLDDYPELAEPKDLDLDFDDEEEAAGAPLT